jgi:hypothetical protein
MTSGIKHDDDPNNQWCYMHRSVCQVEGQAADSNGHGTHTAGVLAGNALHSNAALVTAASRHNGIAPNAKLAITDGSSSSGVGFWSRSDAVNFPDDLRQLYYRPYEAGARVHSDSWGTVSPAYDINAATSDMFVYEHDDFLPVYAAWNDGDSTSAIGTVGSPATAKNSLSVGSSLTLSENFALRGDMSFAVQLKHSGTVQNFAAASAAFGPEPGTLVVEHRAVMSEPADACSTITLPPPISPVVALVDRGDCTFVTKVQRLQQWGAAAVVVMNDRVGEEELIMGGSGSVRIPAMLVGYNSGVELKAAVAAGGATIRMPIESASSPQQSPDNLSPFSSVGPTRDGRRKPDIIAPGDFRKSFDALHAHAHCCVCSCCILCCIAACTHVAMCSVLCCIGWQHQHTTVRVGS